MDAYPLDPGVRVGANAPTWVFAVLPCVFGAVLSLLFLNSKSFWLDEAESLRIADLHRSIASVALADGGNFALYYVLLHGWLHLGTSDTFVRLLSVIPAVLSVGALFSLGRHLWGSLTGAIAASMLAINPFFIAYAQEARGYSLLLLLCIVSTLFFVRSIEQSNSLFNWAGYVAASVLMVYTHSFGVFVLVAHAAALPFLQRRLPWRYIIASASAILILLLPLARVAVRHGSELIAWIPPLSVPVVGNTLRMMMGGLPLCMLFITLVAYAVFSLVRPKVNAGWSARFLPLILAWLIVPLVLAALISALAVPIFISRYLIIVLPPVILLAAFVVSQIPVRLAALVVVLVAVFSSQGLWQYYFHSPKEDWRGVATLVRKAAANGDAVLCLPAWLEVPLQHATLGAGDLKQFPELIPVEDIGQTGFVEFDPSVNDALARRLAQHARIWLVQGDLGSTGRFQPPLVAQREAVVRALYSGRRLELTRSFTGVTVQLFSRGH
jgi:mannosyltransferase